MNRLRVLAGRIRDSALWRPHNFKLLWNHLVRQNTNLHHDDRVHLLAAADWLRRAQDATDDGGICGRFHLNRGWSGSYPETTGYLIPTLLKLEEELEAADLRDRAERCVEFLLSVQFPDGAFPGGEIGHGRPQPAVFNTAQIISGLVAWHAATGDATALEAARRAAAWLISVQDDDGAWRRHVYLEIPTTYSAHASCWLAELGAYCDDANCLQAAKRHLDWVLGHQDPDTGWFRLCGFSALDHNRKRAVTHTIAYTLWGVLLSSQYLDCARGIEAVSRAATGIGRRLQLSRRLSSDLDHRWHNLSNYTCPTGNVQLALVWLRLFEIDKDATLVNAALLAIDSVKQTQPLDYGASGFQGGIPGSYPVWGGYISLAFPNWAVKFFVDALLQKRRILEQMDRDPEAGHHAPSPV